MEPLTSYERVMNTLTRKPVDCVPCYDAVWDATVRRWREEGHLGPDEDVREHLGMDINGSSSLNSVANLDFEAQLIEENEDTRMWLDGNGARLRHHKHHDSCPEHVGFSVTERESWEKLIKPHLLDLDRRRIPFEAYRKEKRVACEKQRFFTWWGVAPFEQMHPVCGHENLLVGMALDPEWVQDMVMTYARFTIRHLEVLFAEEGLPDAMWFGEDLGFKFKPFMSPAMYEEILEPGHKLLFDWSHSLGLKVLVHSCGFVEPLVPGLLRAGMDCLQALEVKAGMDMLRLQKDYGDRLVFFGNIDARVLISNERAQIEEEMQRKIPPLLQAGGAYILMSDHSIPPQVDHDTMHFFFERGQEISRKVLWGVLTG